MFVLDPKVQNGQKIPNWNQHFMMGQFHGFSDERSSLTAKVRNLATVFISPEFHVVFDDVFQTVFSSGKDDGVLDAICKTLFDHNHDIYVDDEFDSEGKVFYHPPPLDEVWLDEFEHDDGRERLRRQRQLR